ncbi:MAG: DUF2384 domain-containing protein [Bacteroidota bacterium]|nr:DUF2384 domain-containing protein [Bacteroidota bacterium]
METRETQIEKLEDEIRNYIKGITHKETNITYEDFLSNKLLTIKALEKGIPFSISYKILEVISPLIWSKVLNLSSSRLAELAKTKKSLSSIDSEKIIELAEVVEFGRKVFENDEKFRIWLDTQNEALGNVKPMTLLKYNSGKQMVIDEIGRIEYGILA